MTSPPFLSPGENFLALDQRHSNPATARVIVLPVPFEQTSSYGHGSANGPDAILAASHEVELFDAALGFEPVEAAGGIATCSPLDVSGHDGESLCPKLRVTTRDWLAQGKFVVTLGGEHTSVVGAILEHGHAFEDLTVIQFDAHSDLRPDYLDSPWNHACAMARVLDFQDSLVQVGIRSQAKEERQFSDGHGLPVFYAHAVHDAIEAGNDWIGEVIAATRPNVYVTFDCDVFDPAVMPATGTPEPGGLTWRQVDAFLARLCRERRLVGFDVSELAPVEGLNHPQFTMAKLIYRLIGYRFGGEHTRDSVVLGQVR